MLLQSLNYFLNELKRMNRTTKFNNLTKELLTHKYHYYMKDDPIISDYEYDKLEREWISLGKELGINMDDYPNWIGFDENHPLAKEVLEENK